MNTLKKGSRGDDVKKLQELGSHNMVSNLMACAAQRAGLHYSKNPQPQ